MSNAKRDRTTLTPEGSTTTPASALPPRPTRAPFDAGAPPGMHVGVPGLEPMPFAFGFLPSNGLPVGGPGVQPGLTGVPSENPGYGSRIYPLHVDEDVNDLSGFMVYAKDGFAGRVSRESHRLYNGDLLVEAGRWYSHQRVVVPRELVSGVDLHGHVVRVKMSKDQVRHPEHRDREP